MAFGPVGEGKDGGTGVDGNGMHAAGRTAAIAEKTAAIAERNCSREKLLTESPGRYLRSLVAPRGGWRIFR